MANNIIIKKLGNNNVEVINSITNIRSLRPELEVIKDKNGVSVTVLNYDSQVVYCFLVDEVEKVIRQDGSEILITDQETLYTELRDNFFFLVFNGVNGTYPQVSTRNDLPVVVPPNIGDVYLVEFPVTQTVLGIPYKTYQSGLYIRDFANGNLNDWRRLNIKVKFTTTEFRLVSPIDTGKQMGFNVDSAISGTVNIHTLQGKDGTLAHLSDIPPATGEANTTSNQGGGEGLALPKVGVDLPFKTLVAGTNVTLTPAADTLTISSTGGAGGLGHRHIYFAANNVTVTPIAAANTPVKIQGSTTFGFGTAGWDMPVSNRITNNTGSTKRVHIVGSVSIIRVDTGLVEDYIVYIAQTGSVLIGSKQSLRGSRTHYTSCFVNWVGDIANGQYVELFIANEDGADDVRAKDLSLSVFEL